ncbi:MAG: ABC transporter permease [Phycisphaeraceae bacterium]|nr:MAG: ABC transporter permease [Phycisphaeraceae bacterium]
MNDWTIIGRSLAARLFSTATAAALVAVAVGLLLVLLMMRDSARKAFERGTGNMHLLVAVDASPLNALLNNVFYAGVPRAPMTEDAVERLKKTPMPAARGMPLGAALEWAIPVQIGDSYKGRPVLATEPEFFTKFQPVEGEPWRLRRGRFFEEDWEVVVGALAAREAGLKVGDEIVLTHGSGDSRAGGGAAAAHVHDEFAYTVVGILEPSGSPHDRALFTNLRSSWMIHAFDRLEREAGGHDHHHDHDHGDFPVCMEDVKPEDRLVTALYLRVAGRPGSGGSALLPTVFDFLRRNPGLVQGQGGDPRATATSFVVAQPSQEITRLMGIVGNIDVIIIGIAACVLVSSAVAIMLAMYNSMDQRRRQIAILRVLGCSRPRVFGLVVTEAVVVGLIGAASGVVVALAGSFLVVEALKNFTGLVIRPEMPWDLAAVVAACAVILSAVAGLAPAALAYRVPVAKNLSPLG